METINLDQKRIFKTLFFVAVASISVLLTVIFFLAHFRFAGLYAISPVLNALAVVPIGLIASDVGALAWRRIYLHSTETARQVNLARFMMYLCLLLTTLTTFGGLSDAWGGSASIIPASANELIGWVILVVIALEFVVGVFLFDLHGAQLVIQQEIIGALTTEALEVVGGVKTAMLLNRGERVAALAATASGYADALIRATLAIQYAGTPKGKGLVTVSAESPAHAPTPTQRPALFSAAPDPDPDCCLVVWSDGQMPMVLDVGAQTTLISDMAQRRRDNPGLRYAVVSADSLAHIAGDALPTLGDVRPNFLA